MQYALLCLLMAASAYACRETCEVCAKMVNGELDCEGTCTYQGQQGRLSPACNNFPFLPYFNEWKAPCVITDCCYCCLRNYKKQGGLLGGLVGGGLPLVGGLDQSSAVGELLSALEAGQIENATAIAQAIEAAGAVATG